MAGWETIGTVGHGFSAYRSTSQSIASGAHTVIIFNTEDFDADSDYNTSTGIYTPSIAGYYIISTSITLIDLGDGKKFIARLLKNGSTVQGVDRGIAGGAGYVGACVSSVIHFNGSTDYVTATFYHDHGASRFVDGTQGYTKMSGWILPAP